MKNCSDCLYQGDMNADQKGNIRVFCLVNANWIAEKTSCGRFKENADISKEVKNRLAMEIRQEDAEDRRLKKVAGINFRFIMITLIISFFLFWLTVKFFDKYIF